MNLGIALTSRRPHFFWRTPGFVISDLLSLFFVWSPGDLQPGCGPKRPPPQSLAPIWPRLDAIKPELGGAYTPILPEGPVMSLGGRGVMGRRGGTTDLSFSSQTQEAHTDSMGVQVLFVFRISNFFIIFFRFSLDFFL